MQNVFNWLVKWYENETTNVLKMIARAFGWSLFGICYLFGLDTHWNFYVLAISILSIDIAFLASRKFESNYKTKAFFKNEKTTVESLDLYQVLMAAIKFVAIIPAIIFDSIEIFGIASLIMAPVIASIAKFKPFMPNGHGSVMSSSGIHNAGMQNIGSDEINATTSNFPDNAFSCDCTTNSYDNISSDPPNFGVPGFDVAGMYTGSSTAVGGISN